MSPIPSFVPSKRRVRRRRKPAVATRSPTPVLVAVWYETAQFVTMEFDRAVDLTNFDSTVIRVDDPNYGLLEGKPFVGVMTPERFQVSLQLLGDPTGADITMTVPDGNGIVAASDGAAWAGVTGVVIPFGN